MTELNEELLLLFDYAICAEQCDRDTTLFKVVNLILLITYFDM